MPKKQRLDEILVQNNFFETPFLVRDDNAAYITSLIDYIDVKFDYNFMSTCYEKPVEVIPVYKTEAKKYKSVADFVYKKLPINGLVDRSANLSEEDYELDPKFSKSQTSYEHGYYKIQVRSAYKAPC